MKTLKLIFLLTLVLAIVTMPVQARLVENFDTVQQTWAEKLVSAIFSPFMQSVTGDAFVPTGTESSYKLILDYQTVCAGVKSTAVLWTVNDKLAPEGVTFLQIKQPSELGMVVGAYYSVAEIRFNKAGTYNVQARYSCGAKSDVETMPVTVATSVKSECTPGTVRCLDSITRQACQTVTVSGQAVGVWGDVATCGAYQQCNSATALCGCIKQECNSGETRCSGTTYQACEGSGGCRVWSSPKPLPAGRVCSDGNVCVSQYTESRCAATGSCESGRQEWTCGDGCGNTRAEQRTCQSDSDDTGDDTGDGSGDDTTACPGGCSEGFLCDTVDGCVAIDDHSGDDIPGDDDEFIDDHQDDRTICAEGESLIGKECVGISPRMLTFTVWFFALLLVVGAVFGARKLMKK